MPEQIVPISSDQTPSSAIGVVEIKRTPEKFGLNVVRDPITKRIISGNLNPAGKPAGIRHMTTLLKEAIVKVAEGNAEPSDVIIVKTAIKQAERGDDSARALIWDRLDGKAPQTIVHEGDGLDVMTAKQKAKLNALLGITEEKPEEEIIVVVATEPPKVEEQPQEQNVNQ